MIAYAGILIALNVILTRFVSIPLGQILRISIGQVPVILSGLWLGPLIGGITGAAGDLIGCLFSGYVPVPLITVSAALMGIIPGVFKAFIVKAAPGKRRFWRLLLIIAGSMLVTSQGITAAGLSLFYGLSFKAVWISRLPQTALLCAVNTFLVNLIFSRIRPSLS